MCKKWFVTDLLESPTFLILTLIVCIVSLFLLPREDALLRYWMGKKCAFLWQSKMMMVTKELIMGIRLEVENLDIKKKNHPHPLKLTPLEVFRYSVS